MKKLNKKAERFFKKNERFFYAALVALGFSAYLLMPGCGGNKNNNNANVLPPTCLPGQICTGPGAQNAQGIPLINGPTFSALDQQGSQLVLTWAAPQYNAGQAYNGTVNVAGTLRLSPGSCYGMAGGDYQVQGQGTWYSGYAGAIAGVQAQLQVVGGGYQQQPYNPYGGGYPQPTSGSVSISQSLIRDGGTQSGYGYAYSLTQGYGVYVSMCNRTFAYYNN